ncbi:Ankyrin repeat protein 1 [Giardia duodenalis]|uniref:Ankyrin repeat protein 1 n=1 Tax=Giardia intestinalis (strain ATCC 50803 / WB clone C6) TaxID=184922 RepID=A8BRP4_GIAIC|nr:Ankyrin repeat protein 1 [Giardia intestinalis]KAE8305966.1 Ankyrin repeat protein 1 [Giardia intestinalis]|eukprot:XP_001705318.1 Ankyrin 1 [Giardia lamblia ATCC 50803]
MPLCTPKSTPAGTVRISDIIRAFHGSKRGGLLFRYTLRQARKNPQALFRYHDVEGNHVLHHCVLRKAAADVQSLMNYITISKFERVEICNSVNAQGQTALHIAVLNGDSTMVQMLLKFGVNPLVRDNNGYTCIHNACRHRDYQSMVDIVNILLSWNPQLASVTSENGRTPLMLAVQECNTVLTRTILSHLVAFTKYTPLLSDEATTPRQGTPSFLDTYFRTSNLTEYFQSTTPDNQTVFHIAAINRSTDLLKLLLDISGITEFTYSSEGYLPIHYACKNGDSNSLMVLHSVTPELLGSLEHSRTRGKKTYPLHLVAASGYTEALRFVLCHGGGFACNIQDHRKRTPLHYAALQEDPASVQMLLEFGCDPLMADDEGQTAIDIALQRNSQGSISAMRQVLDKNNIAVKQLLPVVNTLTDSHLSANTL